MVDKLCTVRLVFNSLYKRYLNKNRKLRKKYLIMFCGLPGSGKTFIADILEDTSYFIKISSDDIKNLLRSKKIKFTLSDIFFIQHKIIVDLLREGFSVISDSNSDQVSYRNKLKAIARKNNAKPLVISLPVNMDLSIKRYIKKRNLKSTKKINSAIKMIKDYSIDLSKPRRAIIINHQISKKHTIMNLKKELIKHDKIFYNVLKRLKEKSFGESGGRL